MYVLCFVFCGKLFTSTGKFISINPTRFSPKIKISDERNNTQYGLLPPPKTFPVNAQIIPTTVRHNDKPKINDNIWSAVVEVFSFEYPPM